MNTLMLVVVVLVLFVYFGGSKVPSVLRQNKEMLLGGAGALVLCSFFGLRMEGFSELEAIEAGCCGRPSPDSCLDLFRSFKTGDSWQDHAETVDRACTNPGDYTAVPTTAKPRPDYEDEVKPAYDDYIATAPSAAEVTAQAAARRRARGRGGK
jgi:hypothetical protein